EPDDGTQESGQDSGQGSSQVGDVGSSSGIGFGGPGPRPGAQPPEESDDPFAGLLNQLMAGGIDPAQLAAAGIPTDPAMLNQVLSQVQRMLTTASDGPVNWDLATDLARQATAQAGDPSVGATAARQ